MNKVYEYKVYDGTEYLGVFSNVTSIFNYTQKINSAGAQLLITLKASFDDTGTDIESDLLVDESGNYVVDENGNNVAGSISYIFSNIPIGLNNRVKVFMFDPTYPNGTQVFDGLISKWSINTPKDEIRITVLSYGVQLDNYIVGAGSTSTPVSQTTADTEYQATVSSVGDKGSLSPDNTLRQTFDLAVDTIVESISIYCRASSIALGILQLVGGTPSSPGSVYATVEKYIVNTTAGYNDFIFSTPLELPAGTYHWALQDWGYGAFNTPTIYVSANSAGGYASGALYNNTSDTGDDATFDVNASLGSSATTFDLTDPGNIVRSIGAQLEGQGSLITYDTTTVELVGNSSTYTYRLATAYEGVQKALELSPGNWYWYIDVATNELHFHPTVDSADHNLVSGKHLKELDLEFTLEDMVNLVHFSGGDTGAGDNLYKVYSDTSSISSYGQWLQKRSDNRVSLEDTADVIGANAISHGSSPVFSTPVAIPTSVYDTETIALGQMVALKNFNDLLDNILFQVVSINRSPQLVQLILGTVPPKASSVFEETRRRLDALETIDNTDEPL